MTLTEFLMERIAEDEAIAKAGVSCGYAHPGAGVYHFGGHPDRFRLAECETKRRIMLVACEAWMLGGNAAECMRHTLLALAAPYADHPDYQQEWALTASQDR